MQQKFNPHPGLFVTITTHKLQWRAIDLCVVTEVVDDSVTYERICRISSGLAQPNYGTVKTGLNQRYQVGPEGVVYYDVTTICDLTMIARLWDSARPYCTWLWEITTVPELCRDDNVFASVNEFVDQMQQIFNQYA